MEKQKFKQTEIGEIPEDWEVLSIETLISRELIEKPLDGNHGNIHPKNNDFIEDGIPFVMANNIHDGNLNLKTCHYISQKQADKLQKGFAIIGDVLLTHKGTVGNVAIVEKLETPYIMLTPQVTYYRVKNSNMLCSSYIKQYFQYNLFQQTIKNISGGGTRAYIGITTQRQLPFILSSIQEQIAIATVLSDTDELITSLDKLIAKKKAIKQCAMQELLTGKKRLPRFSGEWKEKALQELVDFSNGKAHETFISKDGRFIVVNSKFISSNGEVVKYSNKAFALAPAKSVLMVMSDVPNGKAIAKCFIVEEESKYTVNQRICCLVPNIDPKFLFYKINRNPWYLSFDDGVKQTNLRKEDVLTCKLTLPVDHQEQVAISTILSNMDSELESLEKKRDKYLMIKQGMMQQLLTGKIRLI